MKLAMVGLGKMGANMSRRLMCGGHQVVACDVSRESVEALARDGAEASTSLADAVKRLASPIDRSRARTTPAFCIGPVAAEQAQHSGFNVAAIAAEHTAAGLANAIAGHFARKDR